MRTCFFNALRWTGAASLIWLGVQAWRHAGEESERLRDSGRARFLRGLLVALSNPKTIVFFTAFLPQFIDPRLPAGPQLAAMCVASVIIAGASDCAWAVAAGMGRAWFMKPSPRQTARPTFRNRAHRRRFVAFARPAYELSGSSTTRDLAMPNLTTIISVAGAAFVASFVEAVEALTVVLAVGPRARLAPGADRRCGGVGGACADRRRPRAAAGRHFPSCPAVRGRRAPAPVRFALAAQGDPARGQNHRFARRGRRLRARDARID